jgi:hypothetical protein
MKKKKRNTKNTKQNAWIYIIYPFFLTILVCEMKATGLIKKNGMGYCDHKWVKRFVRLMYSCTDLKIYRFCISVKMSSPKSRPDFNF